MQWRAVVARRPELSYLESGADVQPLRRLINMCEKCGWGPLQQSCLFSVVVGAAPCQQKLYEMGLASTSAVRMLCGTRILGDTARHAATCLVGGSYRGSSRLRALVGPLACSPLGCDGYSVVNVLVEASSRY